MPSSERPRERLAALGTEALSQQELLACLLGRGCAGESVITVAQRLLNRFGGLERIAQAPLEELAGVRGIGLAKAAQLKAACELSRRADVAPRRLSAPLETPDAAMRLAKRYLARRRKEHFIVLLLDTRHRVMKVSEISVGSLEASLVHPRETFQEAIAASAAALILAHNHPSGDPTPSAEDLDLTRRLKEAGEILGIPVLDHLIVGGARAVSLQAAGFLGEG
ncbi:MAG: DNA repair protein RadC [Candidatus Omnitrophica bacterium]|nr:DNA repair protein RadC [Candidatus Omnitrophota bacterium]